MSLADDLLDVVMDEDFASLKSFTEDDWLLTMQNEREGTVIVRGDSLAEVLMKWETRP